MNNKTGQNYKKGTYFEVENILKDIIENGKRKFLVKWKNYSDSWNGWVEEEDMSCPNMISEYESKKRTQLKRKIEETDELGLSSKRRKNQEALIDVNVAEELFEMKTKLNNIENLLINLTNELKMMKQHGVASSAISTPTPTPPPLPPPMQGFIQPKKLQAAKTPQSDGVLNELNELFKRGPILLKKVEQDKSNEQLREPMNTKKLKHVEQFQTLKLKKTPQLPVGNKLKK